MAPAEVKAEGMRFEELADEPVELSSWFQRRPRWRLSVDLGDLLPWRTLLDPKVWPVACVSGPVAKRFSGQPVAVDNHSDFLGRRCGLLDELRKNRTSRLPEGTFFT